MFIDEITILGDELYPIVNLNQLLVNTLHANQFELETLPLVPGDRFYYFPHLANIREAIFFGAAVTINGELISSIGSPTSLTYLLGGVDDRMGFIMFLHCLHTFTGTPKTGAFFIDGLLFICDWTEPALQQFEELLFDENIDEVGINFQYNEAYNRFWWDARRYHYFYNAQPVLSAADIWEEQRILMRSFINLVNDFTSDDN